MKSPISFLNKEKKTNEALEKVKLLKDMAQNCLRTKEFEHYKKEYEKTRDYMINFLMENVKEDPVQDAFFVRTMLSKLSAMNMLLNIVERDAGRKV